MRNLRKSLRVEAANYTEEALDIAREEDERQGGLLKLRDELREQLASVAVTMPS